jgi:hypothetical protein
MEVWRMDIGSGFGGDNRQRILRIALIAGVALVVLLLILIVATLVRRAGGADPTATVTAAPSRSASPIVASASPSARPTVAVSVAPSAAPSAPATSAPPAGASAQPSASAAGKAYVVANTGGEGVRLRPEPSTAQPEIATLPDNTRLVEIGPAQNVGGINWLRVRVQGGDFDGREGYVSAEFTAPAP